MVRRIFVDYATSNRFVLLFQRYELDSQILLATVICVTFLGMVGIILIKSVDWSN